MLITWQTWTNVILVSVFPAALLGRQPNQDTQIGEKRKPMK